MSEAQLFPVTTEAKAHTYLTDDQYQEMYQQSVINPEGFWRGTWPAH